MTAQGKIRILGVDDHPLFLEGIATMIGRQPDMILVSQVSSAGDAIREYAVHRPDVTLMDVRLPDLSGIDALIAILASYPQARILMLTNFDGDMDILRALDAGAYGYLLKNVPPSEIVQAIREVHAGKKTLSPVAAMQLAEHVNEHSLTAREVEILEQVASGCRNRDIGERFRISEDTVKVHLKHIMTKLGARDRTQASAIALRRGIIHL